MQDHPSAQIMRPVLDVKKRAAGDRHFKGGERVEDALQIARPGIRLVDFVHAQESASLINERLSHRIKRVRRGQKMIRWQIKTASGIFVVWVLLLQILDHPGGLAYATLAGDHVASSVKWPVRRQYAPIWP